MSRDHLEFKKSLPEDVHLPNKNEAKLLRKIKQETGMDEEEIRKLKTYRQQLALASRNEGDKNRIQRHFASVIKKATKELKLPKEHSDTIDRIIKIIEEQKKRFHSSMLSHKLPTSNEGIREMMRTLDKIKDEKDKRTKVKRRN